MAKKNFTSGIDSLLEPTTTGSHPATSNVGVKDTITGVHVLMPQSLKRKIDIHCAESGQKKKDFIIQVLTDYFK